MSFWVLATNWNC